jgi:hypothetical protein
MFRLIDIMSLRSRPRNLYGLAIMGFFRTSRLRTRHVDEMNTHLESQVGLILWRQLLKGVLVDVVSPHHDVHALATHEVDALTLQQQHSHV